MQYHRTPGRTAMTDIGLRPPRIGAGAAIALIWIIVGVAFYLDPSVLVRSQIGQTIEPWDYLWNALYIIGGLAVLAERIRGHHIVGAENLGVCLLSAGWLINLIAVVYTRGPELRTLTYIVFIWWGYSRYRHLSQAAA